MLKKAIKNLANRLGYDVRRASPVRSEAGFELYQYRHPDGTFDYERYRQVQEAGNKRKIENVWVIEDNIKFLSTHIKDCLGETSFGLCHGTRRGKEQEWFSKYLGCDVIGTEISDTADKFPNTIQWDFHDVKPEWVDSVDFIYSNSFDHSYDPQKCLKGWMSCLRPRGLCILEHTSFHERADELDPFGADICHMPYLILTWSEGDFCVTNLLTAPSKPESLGYVQYLVIRKTSLFDGSA